MKSTSFAAVLAASLAAIGNAAPKYVTGMEPRPQVTDIQKPLDHIAFASCNDQSMHQPMWPNVLNYDPDLWIWMGDNIYADMAELDQPKNWSRKLFVPASADELRKRYAKLYSEPNYAKLVETTPMIGVWDDHDYGINDGGNEFEFRVESQQVFLDFIGEAKDSPRRKQEGVYSSYVVGEGNKTVKFILMDARYHRDPYGTVDGDFLGDEQWKWLEKELMSSNAAFNVLVSGIQVLSGEYIYMAERWNRFPKQRQRLLELILRSNAKGVLLLSGDVHFAELNQVICSDGKNVLTEVTSSGMTHSWMQFHNPNIKLFAGLMFTMANMILPWQFRPEQDAFYGYINWGTMKFDWESDVPTATVQVRGRDDTTKLEYTVSSVPVHSDNSVEDAAACRPPRPVSKAKWYVRYGAMVAVVATSLVTMFVSALVFVWMIWFALSSAAKKLLIMPKPAEKKE